MGRIRIWSVVPLHNTDPRVNTGQQINTGRIRIWSRNMVPWSRNMVPLRNTDPPVQPSVNTRQTSITAQIRKETRI